MAEVEIAGAKIKGGKILLILPILGTLGNLGLLLSGPVVLIIGLPVASIAIIYLLKW